MKNIVELREERSHKIRSAKDIVDRAEKEDRQMTDEEKRASELLLKDAAEIAAEIEAIEDHEKRAAKIREAAAALSRPEERKVSPDQPSNGTESRARIEIPSRQVRFGALQAYKGPGAEERAFTAGQWIRATIFGSYRAQKWCQDHGVEVRSHVTNDNAAGGALVPDVMAQAIIDLREEFGVFRRAVGGPFPMGRDSLLIPRRAGSHTAYFVGEGQSITESQSAWNNVQLVAKKLGVLSKISTEIDEDAIITFGDWVTRDIAWAMAYKEDLCGFLGDGTSTYGGITGLVTKFEAGTSLKGYVDAATGHDTVAEIDVADIAGLMGALPQYARRNAKFYLSSTYDDVIFGRLLAGAGGNTVQTLQGTVAPAYLGHERVITQVMPSALTAQDNKVLMLFGDLSLAATLGERRGISMARSEDRYFEEDMVGIKATSRIDINVHDIGDGTNAGPVVALIGKTS